MNWRIRISNKEATLEEVAKVHNSTVQSVLNFLIDNELPEHCIQSSGMEFGENFVTSKLKGRVRSGYQASSSIKFKVTDLSKYKDLWSGISRMDNVSLNGISYDNSKRIKHRKDIRQKALLAAKDKAQKLAETLDSKIGKHFLLKKRNLLILAIISLMFMLTTNRPLLMMASPQDKFQSLSRLKPLSN